MTLLRQGWLVVTLVAALVITATSPAPCAERSLVAGVLAEMNLARTSPAAYARLLSKFRERYRGREIRKPGSSSVVVTEEGVAAVDEAIRFLKRQQPVAPLIPSAGLRKAASDLVADEGKSGALGHTGPESGDTQERIERHGIWRGKIGENISYGPTDPRTIVMSLIIDDGVPDRGHRRNIFDRSFRTVGIACGPHIRFGTMCVMDFATAFRKRR